MRTPRVDAAAKGEVRYTGQACKKCGNAVRYTSTSQCVECVKTRTYDARHKIRGMLKKARGGE